MVMNKHFGDQMRIYQAIFHDFIYGQLTVTQQRAASLNLHVVLIEYVNLSVRNPATTIKATCASSWLYQRTLAAYVHPVELTNQGIHILDAEG
jgi:hypothetical protein